MDAVPLQTSELPQRGWLQFRLSSLMLIPLILGLFFIWGDEVFDHFLLLMIGYGAIIGGLWSVGRIPFLERSTAGARRALRVAWTGLCGGAIAGSIAGPVLFLSAIERDTAGLFKDLLLTRAWHVSAWEFGTAMLVGAWIGTIFAAAGGVVCGMLTVYLLRLIGGKPSDHESVVALDPSTRRQPGGMLRRCFIPAAYLVLLAIPPSWLAYERIVAGREAQAETRLKETAVSADVQYKYVGPIWCIRYRGIVDDNRKGPFWRAYSVQFIPNQQHNDWQWLAGFPRIERLSITGKAINDAELARLVEHLKNAAQPDELVLWLHDTEVSDDGLEPLSKLPQLTQLWVADRHITDAGLKHLERLRNLRYLDVRFTQISPAGLAAFQAKRPAVRIQPMLTAPAAAPTPAPVITNR